MLSFMYPGPELWKPDLHLLITLPKSTNQERNNLCGGKLLPTSDNGQPPQAFIIWDGMLKIWPVSADLISVIIFWKLMKLMLAVSFSNDIKCEFLKLLLEEDPMQHWSEIQH